MIDKFVKYFRKEYLTLNKIEISKANLIANYKYLSLLNENLKIAPVLKSNAYGHGILEVASILDPLGTPFFCVDSLYEAYELLKANIKTPVLIMGYTEGENFKVKRLPFSYALFDLNTAKILNKYQPGCSVHLFVDTGMHREGLTLENLSDFIDKLKKFKNLRIVGLMSHLATADNPNNYLNQIQVKNFQKALLICKENNIHPQWIHLSNSDGLLSIPYLYSRYTPGGENLARIGLALYGIGYNPNLKPVLNLKSKITQIKKLKKGDRVGYGGTFVANRPLTIGTLPLGYYDGFDFRLSNKGFIKVNNIFCPIVGKISMNITTIDLNKVKDVQIGQEVVIYSNDFADKNSINESAKICNTIPYNLLVHLAESTKRSIV